MPFYNSPIKTKCPMAELYNYHNAGRTNLYFRQKQLYIYIHFDPHHAGERTVKYAHTKIFRCDYFPNVFTSVQRRTTK